MPLQEIGRIYKSVVRELKLQEELGNKQVGCGGSWHADIKRSCLVACRQAQAGCKPSSSPTLPCGATVFLPPPTPACPQLEGSHPHSYMRRFMSQLSMAPKEYMWGEALTRALLPQVRARMRCATAGRWLPVGPLCAWAAAE